MIFHSWLWWSVWDFEGLLAQFGKLYLLEPTVLTGRGVGNFLNSKECHLLFQANDIDFKDITREEAVLILLSLGDEVNLLCKYRRQSKRSSSGIFGESFSI